MFPLSPGQHPTQILRNDFTRTLPTNQTAAQQVFKEDGAQIPSEHVELQEMSEVNMKGKKKTFYQLLDPTVRSLFHQHWMFKQHVV